MRNTTTTDTLTAPSRRILFDHFPKTAGTSVRAALSAACHALGELAEVPCPHRIALRRAGTSRVLAGHLWFAPGERLAPGWAYVTLVRDPIDRLVSQYHYYRSHRDGVARGTITDPEVAATLTLAFDEYVAHPIADRSVHNAQATHFAARMAPDVRRLADPQLLDAAIASLEEYDVVGVFEDVAGFVRTCTGYVGTPVTLAPRVNVTASRPSLDALSPSLRARLIKQNTVDHALYRWAQTRWRHRRTDDRRSMCTSRRGAARVRDSREFGSEAIRILGCVCLNAEARSGIAAGEPAEVQLAIRSLVHEPDLTIGIAVRDREGHLVYATNTRALGTTVSVRAQETCQWTFTVPPLSPGSYVVTLALHRGWSHEDGCYHWRDEALTFDVRAAVHDLLPRQYWLGGAWTMGAVPLSY